MLKNVKNKKGFTLIELLAVIVILGVLMIVAIPMVSQYIREARQNSFVATAKAYITAARYGYLNEEYITAKNAGGTCATLDSGAGQVVYIMFEDISVDKTGGKSSFGQDIDTANSYVKIVSEESGKYTYSVFMRDSGGNGIEETKEDELKRKNVKTNIQTSNSKVEAGKVCAKS